MTRTRKTTRTIIVSAAFGVLLSAAGPALAASTSPLSVRVDPRVQMDQVSASVGNDPFARFDGTHVDVNNWMQNTVEWLGGPRP